MKQRFVIYHLYQVHHWEQIFSEQMGLLRLAHRERGGLPIRPPAHGGIPLHDEDGVARAAEQECAHQTCAGQRCFRIELRRAVQPLHLEVAATTGADQ